MPEGRDDLVGPSGLLAAASVGQKWHAHDDAANALVGHKPGDGLKESTVASDLQLVQRMGNDAAGVADGDADAAATEIEAEDFHGEGLYI